MTAWPSTNLGEIFEIARGGSPRPIEDFITDDPNGINWIMIGDAPVGSKYITRTKKRISLNGVSRSRQVKPGDFLLTNSMSFGRPYILKTSGCIHDGWLVLSPKGDTVDPDYFFHLLGSPDIYCEFSRLAAGATVKNLNIDLVRSVEIRLPPIPEQRRIAAILDQADALRAKRRAALAQLDEMAQAIFVEMFGSPFHNPKNFPECKLGDIIDFVGGAQPPKSTFLYEDGPDRVRFIQIRDFRTDAYKTYVPTNLAKRPFNENDVMIGRYGPPVFQIFRGMSGTYNVALMKASPRANINHDFIYYLLQEPVLHSYVVENSERTAGQSGVNLTLLENYPAFRPPVSLQQQFSKIVLAVSKYQTRAREHEKQLDALFASLQHRAFNGEL